MIRKLHLRALPILLVLAAAFAFAACHLPGLPSGEAYLTIQNTSTSSYTQVFVDSKSLPDIAAGNSYRTAVTIGQHDVTLYYNSAQVGPTVINVPSQGCTLNGPNATQSGFTGC